LNQAFLPRQPAAPPGCGLFVAEENKNPDGESGLIGGGSSGYEEAKDGRSEDQLSNLRLSSAEPRKAWYSKAHSLVRTRARTSRAAGGCFASTKERDRMLARGMECGRSAFVFLVFS
jgi:hypothetical protein